MSEYYDREKFSGDRPPQRPPQRRNNDSDWMKWVAIIVLFSTGLWPIALLVLFSSLSDQKKNVKKQAAREREERVARALAQAEERVARARENMERANGGTLNDERVAQALAQAEERVARARENVERRTAVQETMAKKRDTATTVSYEKTSAGKTVTVNGQAVSKPKKDAKQKTPGKALRIIGICLLVLGSIICIDGVSSLLQGWDYALSDLMTGFGFVAGGAVSMGRGEYLAKMSRRAQRYILAIGTADTMSINEIAKRVNRTPDKAAKELQKLIDKGLLGEDSYIDHEKGVFARFGAVVEDDEPVITEVPVEAEEGYSGILRNMRLANDRIPDEALSNKIERLEQISALIFKEVEAHPEKRDRIRTFFDYYLPTTQKLLDTYAEFDEMGVEGENMTQAKARIAEMMDSIVEGFEHQLDQLYSADAMDVVSDIKVMETMLNRDTASAAKDFGYEMQSPKKDITPQQMEM